MQRSIVIWRHFGDSAGLNGLTQVENADALADFNFLEDVQHTFQDSAPKKALCRTCRDKLQAAVTELLSNTECAKDTEHASETVDNVLN